MDLLGILLVFGLVIIFYNIFVDNFMNFNLKKINNLSNSELFDGTQSNDKYTLNLSNSNNNKKSNKSNNYKKKMKNTYKNNLGKIDQIDDFDNVTGDVAKYLRQMAGINENSKNMSILKKEKINPYFQEIQFHQDYRDTLNAFGMMCDQKNIFNKIHDPLIKSEQIDTNEVNDLVSKFVDQLNVVIDQQIGEIATEKLDSWNDNMPLVNPTNEIIKKKASWEQYNEELGLPDTIYPEPATKSKVKLIKIDSVNKYETLKELKYSVFLIIQKYNVVDQMIVKISFVLDKNDVNLDREFFDEHKNNFETKIVVEEISVIGFMITKGMGKPKTLREQFYDYEGFDEGRIISEKDVIRQLNKKKKEIEKEFISSM